MKLPSIGCALAISSVLVTGLILFFLLLFPLLHRHEHLYEPNTITLVRDLPPERLARIEQAERAANFRLPRSAIFIRYVVMGDEEDAPETWVVRLQPNTKLPALAPRPEDDEPDEIFPAQPPAVEVLGKLWQVNERSYRITLKRTKLGDYLAFAKDAF